MDITSELIIHHLRVSRNGGAPKWMIYKGTYFFKIDDLGESTIYGNPHLLIMDITSELIIHHLRVSRNGGAPKWMIYKGTYFLKIDDLGKAPFMETPTC